VTEGHLRVIPRVVHETVKVKEGIEGHPRPRLRFAHETVEGKIILGLELSIYELN
jgi:hypothetical protein